jgi:phosphoglycerol transferase MdoB-like AlkP superfamily enzyme
MKKIVLALVLLGAISLPVIALAQPTGSVTSICQLVKKIESLTWTVFGLIAVICFIYAAILFLTAGGAPEKVQAARSAFLWGVAGVAVGIIAFSIVAIVGSGIGVSVGSSCA